MDLSSALSIKTTEIVRPPILPVGIYRAAVKGPPKKEMRKEYEILEFTMQIIEPIDGVDMDALQAYGTIGPQTTLRYAFLFNSADQVNFARSLFYLKQFLTKTLGSEDNDQSLKELILASNGRQCQVQVYWQPDPQDPEIQHAKIGKSAAI